MYFTYFWKNKTWKRKAKQASNGYSILDYAASDKFKSAKVSPGSTVFIVTNIKGKLYLGGYIEVDQVVNKTQASAYLGQTEKDLWKASEYILAKEGTEVEFIENLTIPLSVTKLLEFQHNEGFKNLKIDREGKLDVQTLRNVRKLYPGSERTFFDYLKSHKKVSSC